MLTRVYVTGALSVNCNIEDLIFLGRVGFWLLSRSRIALCLTTFRRDSICWNANVKAKHSTQSSCCLRTQLCFQLHFKHVFLPRLCQVDTKLICAAASVQIPGNGILIPTSGRLPDSSLIGLSTESRSIGSDVTISV